MDNPNIINDVLNNRKKREKACNSFDEPSTTSIPSKLNSVMADT